MLSPVARIAIIGGGSIGEALLSGLLRAGRQIKDMVVAENDADRAKYLSETYSVLVTTVDDAAENATYVIVAVKPADVESVIGDIAEAAARAENDSAEQVFVTVAAGVSTAYYESKLPAGAPVIRVMPNAPVVVGGGVSALARGRFATAEQLKEVSADLRRGRWGADRARVAARRRHRGVRIGAGVLLPDGRGARRRRSVAWGCPARWPPTWSCKRWRARRRCCWSASTRQQPVGDAAMGTAMDTSAAQLRATVTSPGGTTAAGLRELERGGLRAAVADAVSAAKTRSEQLGITSE